LKQSDISAEISNHKNKGKAIADLAFAYLIFLTFVN
jgi:hypothetical protein